MSNHPLYYILLVDNFMSYFIEKLETIRRELVPPITKSTTSAFPSVTMTNLSLLLSKAKALT